MRPPIPWALTLSLLLLGHSAPRLLAWGAPACCWALLRAGPSRCYPRLLPAPYGARRSAPRLLAWGAPAPSWACLACWALALLPALAACGEECGAVQHCIQHSGGRRAGPSGQARSSYSSVQAQVARQGAPTAACRPKWPGKELLQRRAGPRLLQRRACPSEWPSVAVPRAACWPKWPSEAVFLQRRAGPSGLAVLAQVFRRCGLGLCWIRPSCASCEAQISCSGSNTIVTLTETLLCLRGGRETELHHTRGRAATARVATPR